MARHRPIAIHEPRMLGENLEYSTALALIARFSSLGKESKYLIGAKNMARLEGQSEEKIKRAEDLGLTRMRECRV